MADAALSLAEEGSTTRLHGNFNNFGLASYNDHAMESYFSQVGQHPCLQFSFRGISSAFLFAILYYQRCLFFSPVLKYPWKLFYLFCAFFSSVSLMLLVAVVTAPGLIILKDVLPSLQPLLFQLPFGLD